MYKEDFEKFLNFAVYRFARSSEKGVTFSGLEKIVQDYIKEKGIKNEQQ